jgi:protein TonB
MQNTAAFATPRRPAVLGLVLTAHLSGMLGLAWALHGRPVEPAAARPMSVTVSLLSPPPPHHSPAPAASPRTALTSNQLVTAPSLPGAQSSPPTHSLISATESLEPESGKTHADTSTLTAALPTAPSPAIPPPAAAERVDTGSPAQLPAEHGDCAARHAARLYPAALRERGIEGQVLLRVQVAEDGRAAEVRVQRGSGWRLLDQAAQALALACRYVPARARTQEQLQMLSSWVEVPVRFALQRGSSSNHAVAADMPH